ncbi:MAG: hypothetical protein LBC85_03010 [Fibromonadaceae bacterium]|jgi:uncharacterized Zn finger protein|nr:hypothetical protein [Fibromonadaceae bacterium]
MNLRKRIDRILYAPEIELDGEAYTNSYKLNDVNSIQKFINEKLRLNDKGKNIAYENLDTGDKIIISNNSAGKLASHFRDGVAYQKTIAHIPQIIENMKFLEEMAPDKENAKYGKYSYYITGVKIDGEPYTILSTVGYNKNGVYYDQNLFKGTSEEVFEQAKKETDSKYDRLSEILKNTEKRRLEPEPSHCRGYSNRLYP